LMKTLVFASIGYSTATAENLSLVENGIV